MTTSVLEKAPSPAPSAPPLSDSQEEQQWVRRARTGDMAAYDELVRRYQERIYATIYHMTSNHEDANDLAQETFIKAYQALKSFKGDSSFLPGFTGLPSTRPSTSSSSGRTRHR